MPKAIAQSWTESERGWGQRPDGYSIHLTEEDRKLFNAEFIREERERNPSGAVPDEYSTFDDNSVEVEITHVLHNDLLELKEKNIHGMRQDRFKPGKPPLGWLSWGRGLGV